MIARRIFSAMLYALLIGSVLAFAPEVSRPAPDRVEVRGGDYTGIRPYTEGERVVRGVPLLPGWGWVEEPEGVVVFAVDPMTTYTLVVTTLEPTDGEEPRVEVETSLAARDRLVWILYQRIRWEREFNSIMADEGFTFFDVSEAVGAARAMDEERHPNE